MPGTTKMQHTATSHSDVDVVQASVPQAVALAPVIAAKLMPPKLPPVMVARPDRRRRLDDDHQVTAVVAPAGYGKTVLMREWVDTVVDTPVAWYSLDALDANPLCFWRHLVKALDGAVGLGPEPEAVLVERGADTVFLHLLVHELAARGAVVLVLDDLHLLRDRDTLEQLRVLVELVGPSLRLVFAARTAPALPLARWRLDGRLAEVVAEDLRFDDADAATLLDGFGCTPLAAPGLSQLVGTTEGWVAGLQLAALARPDALLEAVHDLPSDGTPVADYLLTEVLERLPADQRDTALAVSVVDEFDLDMAVALTGRPDCGVQIAALESGNVFLTRRGAKDPTYRFHHLFRELLRQQVRRSDLRRWTALHHTAAAVLAGRGQTDAAFGHLVAVGDVDGAFDLVVRPGLALSDRGWGREFRRWMEQLPADLEIRDRGLMIDLAFAHFTAGRLDVADQWLDRVVPADRRVVIRRLAVEVARGNNTRAAEIIRSLADLPDDIADPFAQRMPTVVARAHLLAGDISATDRLLDELERLPPDRAPNWVAVTAIRARARAIAGSVSEAAALAQRSLADAEAMGLRRNPAVLEAVIASVAAALGAADIDGATAALEELIDVADVVDYPYSRAYTAAFMIELSGQRDGWSLQAERIDEQCGQARFERPSPLEHLVHPLQVRALLAASRITDAQQVVAAMRPGPARLLAEASVLLAMRRFSEVSPRLSRRSGWTARDEVEALVLCALATTGADADRHLRVALQRAIPLGLVSPFLDRGDDMARLLRQAPDDLRSFVVRTSAVEPQRSVPSMVEPLTARERDLLVLLPTHLTNAAIGERLYVSVNTVKTNLRSVYRKLGTTSRSDTVVVARRVGLLPPEGRAG